MPGNAGFLLAGKPDLLYVREFLCISDWTVAYMAAGWDGSEGHAPGFPQAGWVVRHEGLQKAL